MRMRRYSGKKLPPVFFLQCRAGGSGGRCSGVCGEAVGKAQVKWWWGQGSVKAVQV